MAGIASKSSTRKTRTRKVDAEERSLLAFNRLIARAAPRAARETSAALARFRRDIASEIRRAG